jgi:hypothetical protein
MSISQITINIQLKPTSNIQNTIALFDSLMPRYDWSGDDFITWTSNTQTFNDNDILYDFKINDIRFRINPSTNYSNYIKPIENLIINNAIEVASGVETLTSFDNFDLLAMIQNTPRFQKYLIWQKKELELQNRKPYE